MIFYLSNYQLNVKWDEVQWTKVITSKFYMFCLIHPWYCVHKKCKHIHNRSGLSPRGITQKWSLIHSTFHNYLQESEKFQFPATSEQPVDQCCQDHTSSSLGAHPEILYLLHNWSWITLTMRLQSPAWTSRQK